MPELERFGALVVHVTQANYGMGARLGGIKPDVDLASLAKLKDKDQIVAALTASFAFVHKAIGTHDGQRMHFKVLVDRQLAHQWLPETSRTLQTSMGRWWSICV